MFALLQSVIAQELVNNNYVSAIGLKRLSIERSMIYEPDKEWMYSHHPYITFFNNKFIAAWSNGLKDEDNPGQRVAFSISTDFIKWSAPKTLASPSVYKKRYAECVDGRWVSSIQ